MRALFLGAILLTFGGGANAADQCISTLPTHREGHWRYRVLNGERCWYGPGIKATRRHHEDDDPPPIAQRRARAVPKPPVIEPLPVEEEIELDPAPSAAVRTKIVYVTNPPSVSRRIQRSFEDLVTHCQDDIRACSFLTDQ